jgi:hypothetical protein
VVVVVVAAAVVVVVVVAYATHNTFKSVPTLPR